MKFEEIADNLQLHLARYMEELKASDLKDIAQLKNINGIYVFYEEDVPLYVGRTNNNRMKLRIREHSASYSNKNSASFAFRIVKEIKNNPKLKSVDTKDSDFLFAKSRVAKMKIKFVEVNDPIIQTILEPYISFHLDTVSKYNDFRAH